MVRYLNSTGGGRIVRIEGNMAYVDEDGFETPVMLRELVVVAEAGSQPSKTTFREPARPAAQPKAKAAEPAAPVIAASSPRYEEEETEEEIIVEGNEKLNVMIAFEPVDILKLSETTFDVFMVNDSNYYLAYTVITRADGEDKWDLLASGTIEPNMQLLIGNVDREQFPHIERMAMQYVAFKRSAPFEMKPAGTAEVRVDPTKFCKLHCFSDNIYFDTRVLGFEMITDDQPRRREKPVNARKLEEGMQMKKRIDRRPVVKRQIKRSERRNGDIIEVDLHIDQLIDNTRGMSNADILNRQVDEFTHVMDANLQNHGQKIVFIHGKGEGVLRNALMKELNHRYKGHDVQDASFREYGYGATQVTIK